jgi:hypothetical protein
MTERPWLAGDCVQVGNLCWTGYVDAPSGKRWNIAYTPGAVGSWHVFTKFWEAAWECLEWAFTGYIVMLKFFAGTEYCLVEILSDIPKNIEESCKNIGSLIQDTPFGWFIRIIGNVVWTCFLWVIIKTFAGIILLIVIVPIIFLLVVFIACIGKFVCGWIGTITCVLASPFAIMGGLIISSCVTCGGMCNRFPRDSDNGTYGLHIVENKG